MPATLRRSRRPGALLLAAALLLGGCAGVARGTAAADFQVQKEDPEPLVLVSFTTPYEQLHWSYRSVDGREPALKGFVMTSWVMNGSPLKADGAELIPFTLPPGDYEFYKWSQPAQGVYTFSVVPFSLRFSVAPGQVNYIGNVRMKTQGSAFALGIGDKREWDIPAFLQKYTKVASEQVVVRIGQRVEPRKP